MATDIKEEHRGRPAHTTLKVKVKYAAAAKPFEDESADRNETTNSLKARALTAFGLREESLPDGNVVTYKLYHGKEELTDESRTLGDIAGQAHAVEFKLSQFIRQGSSE